MATMILSCTCNSPFQDEKYGKGKRVFNFAVKQNGWRCTVCSKIQQNTERPKEIKK